MKTSNWSKVSTVVNENINLPRKRMASIVLMFTKAARKSSEDYVYPNIESVKITMEGVPNSVLSQGLPKDRFFEEAKRFFFHTVDENMTIESFYKDSFARNGKHIISHSLGYLVVASQLLDMYIIINHHHN